MLDLPSFKPTICISLDEIKIPEAESVCDNAEKEFREKEIIKIEGI